MKNLSITGADTMPQSRQSTNHINMIWSPGFRSNGQTITTNFAQHTDNKLGNSDLEILTQKAKQEFDNLKIALKENGVNVSETLGSNESPDCIFPNNTFSTHADESTVVFYPMLADNRQAELTSERQQQLSEQYDNTLDLRSYRDSGQILEGTGSLVLDRINKTVYASKSPRTNPDLVNKWADELGYETVLFDAFDGNNHHVYHTNVVMWIGTDAVGACLDAIPDSETRDLVKYKLEQSGKIIIEITKEQMDAPNFAGNALEVLNGSDEPILTMSDAAWNAYTSEQQNSLEELYPAGIIHEPIPTIEEFGGGSVRCMLAEIFE